ACGVVTSWIRCRPIRSWVCPDGRVRTLCASHTLSSSVFAMQRPPSSAYAAARQPCSPVTGSARNVKLRFLINAALLQELETLLAVARTGSVAAAARHRHITSSAVSQQIRRLETHFDMKLLERAGRGVRLTAAGEAALPVVRELWTGAESAFE